MKKKQAFTLIEMIVAIALASIALVSIFSMLKESILTSYSIKKRTAPKQEEELGYLYLLDLINRIEISSACPLKQDDHTRFSFFYRPTTYDLTPHLNYQAQIFPFEDTLVVDLFQIEQEKAVFLHRQIILNDLLAFTVSIQESPQAVLLDFTKKNQQKGRWTFFSFSKIEPFCLKQKKIIL